MYWEIYYDLQFKWKSLHVLGFLSKDPLFYTLWYRSLMVEIPSFSCGKNIYILIFLCVCGLASFSSGMCSSILLLRKAQGARREVLCTQGAFYFSGVLTDIFSHILWLGFSLGRDSQCSIWHLKDYTINLADVSLQRALNQLS